MYMVIAQIVELSGVMISHFFIFVKSGTFVRDRVIPGLTRDPSVKRIIHGIAGQARNDGWGVL